MKQTVVDWIRNAVRDGVRKAGWVFLAGFCAGGAFMWWLKNAL